MENMFGIYGATYSPENLEDLRDWCNKMLRHGHTKFRVDLSWGYYNDIDDLTLNAEP